jgi:2-polyprenyl-3-methyl-5-hydroxy-6-metoxy-1,4-benzoquinol methylase
MSWSYFADPRPDVQALVQPAGRRVLDVGCGEGALGAALKAAGAARVVGVELDARAAAAARERLDDVVHGRAEEAAQALAGQAFDYLIFADVLEHLPEPERVLHDLLALLVADGRVVISVPNMRFYLVLARLAVDRWSYTDAGIRDRTHLRIFTRRSLERMLADEGLQLEKLHRNHRLVEDQSQIGRVGAVATRVVRRVVAPVLFRDLLAYQYVVLARRGGGR